MPTYSRINLKKTFALMPWWVKEKARRYRVQQKFAKKLFDPVVKQIMTPNP